MAASEAVPFAKTGGLADVAGALPSALRALGHDVRLVIPNYRCAASSNRPMATMPLRLSILMSNRGTDDYDMHLTGLPWSTFTQEGMEFYGKINLLKAGIVYADRITTVSRRYSEEIQTPKLGYGLDGLLSSRRDDLTGILNGADYARWDPAADPLIPAHYTAADMGGKARCKEELLRRYSLDGAATVPVIGVVGRMADQKGYDSLRYGTIPIVRATGGLDDTITRYDQLTHAGNGFKFEEYTASAMVAAVREALGIYGRAPHWELIRKNAMACDFSWERSAREYERVYHAAMERRGGTGA
ncbi:MAG: glycogen/starch synthase [Candidatus Aureabacteria bacterium]|nr:glycogen/starch synthase [Candidatus Auribacterota bacterium]